jgi:hypothetical protein
MGSHNATPAPKQSGSLHLNKMNMVLNLIRCIMSHYLLGYEIVVRAIPLMDVIKHYSYATNS